jgi:hypothetical protein
MTWLSTILLNYFKRPRCKRLVFSISHLKVTDLRLRTYLCSVLKLSNFVAVKVKYGRCGYLAHTASHKRNY